ncbi:MAG: trigger factor [Flavobacteriales bacterium]|nr:trigger factor [Flavobacteriales bacterium]
MNIERNDLDALNAELSISIAPSDYAERVESAIKKYRKSAQIPGFRPGHVPASLVKQRFGKSILAEEINQVIQDNLYKYISENKIEILGSPIPTGEDDEVGNWDNPGDFKFRYHLGLAPELNIDLNNSLTFDYFKVNVDDTLIDKQAKDLARRYGKMSEPETSGGEDMIIVKFDELDSNGDVKEGGISHQSTVSVEFVTDEITKNKLIGLKIGDEVTVDPRLLSANHEDLGKMLNISHDAVHHLESLFRLTVVEIKRIEPHAVDQELFDKLYGEGEINGVDAFRAKVKGDLENMFAGDSDYLFKREFAKKYTESINPQLPDSFLKKYIALTNEKPVTAEMIEHDYPYYAAQLKWELIEGKIIRQYEVRVAPDDAVAHVKRVLAARYAQYGLPMEDEMLTEFAKKSLAEKEEAKRVYDFLYEEKIMEVVKQNCTLNVKEMSYDDFVHMAQHA